MKSSGAVVERFRTKNVTGTVQGLFGYLGISPPHTKSKKEEWGKGAPIRVEIMLDELSDFEHHRHRVLVHAELTPPQPSQERRPLPLALSVQTTRLEFGRLEDFREEVRARAEWDVGEVVVPAGTGRGDRPEDDEVDGAWVEEGEEVLVEVGGDGRELGREGPVAELGVGREDRSEQGSGSEVDGGRAL